MILRAILAIPAWLLYWLPNRLRLALGFTLGWVLYRMRIRERVVLQNLQLAYPGPGNESERKRIFRNSYTHLGNLILEVLFVFGPLRRFALRQSISEGVENWREAHAKGKGVFFLASHLGNWEIMAATGGAQVGIDLMMVTKRLKPAWLHRAIEAGRSRCGVSGTYEPRTMRDILAHLKRGGTVGIVLDQYAGAPVGIRVPVFGSPVGTPSLLAMLAKRSGAPVLPVINYREPDGTYRVIVRPPVEWKEGDENSEIGANTAIYSAQIEKDIRLRPEQWLWTHRRFKGDLSPLRENEWAEGRARR